MPIKLIGVGSETSQSDAGIGLVGVVCYIACLCSHSYTRYNCYNGLLCSVDNFNLHYGLVGTAMQASKSVMATDFRNRLDNYINARKQI